MTDGISPDAEAIHARYPDDPVAYYADGQWAWSAPQVALFGRHIAITVTGNLPRARVLDVENGDATPQDARAWLLARARLGYADGTVYCDASSVAGVLDATGDVAVPRWWIAWYWEQPGAPSREQVLAEIIRLTSISLPPDKLWACQYATYAQWDLSAVYGQPDFTS